MQLTEEHEQLRNTVSKFIESEINPHVDEWEKDEQFPAHDVFAKLGELGLLGIKYDPECGGLGLDFSYSMVIKFHIRTSESVRTMDGFPEYLFHIVNRNVHLRESGFTVISGHNSS